MYALCSMSERTEVQVCSEGWQLSNCGSALLRLWLQPLRLAEGKHGKSARYGKCCLARLVGRLLALSGLSCLLWEVG